MFKNYELPDQLQQFQRHLQPQNQEHIHLANKMGQQKKQLELQLPEKVRNDFIKAKGKIQ